MQAPRSGPHSHPVIVMASDLDGLDVLGDLCDSAVSLSPVPESCEDKDANMLHLCLICNKEFFVPVLRKAWSVVTTVVRIQILAPPKL